MPTAEFAMRYVALKIPVLDTLMIAVMNPKHPQIFAGRVPFHELPNDAAVVLNVLQGVRPTRPAEISRLHDGIWMIMEASWSTDPSSRLSAGDVLALLVDLDTLGAIEPASDWNDKLTEEIWRNLRHSSYDIKTINDLLNSLERSPEAGDLGHRGRAQRRGAQVSFPAQHIRLTFQLYTAKCSGRHAISKSNIWV